MTKDQCRMTNASLARASAVFCVLVSMVLGVYEARAVSIRASADPVKDERPIKPDDKEHWAFKPLQTSPGQKGIDDLAQPASPPADPATLIRRITFDLIGLPPTPEEVTAFVNECRSGSTFVIRPSTFESLVDKLLASPRYGEHWAQWWLDLAQTRTALSTTPSANTPGSTVTGSSTRSIATCHLMLLCSIRSQEI